MNMYSPITNLEEGISSGEVPLSKYLAFKWYVENSIPGLIFRHNNELCWNHDVWSAFQEGKIRYKESR